MSVKVDPSLRDAAVTVYAAIAEAWNEYGESPTKQELRAATGYSLTTIQQAVETLRKKGYLEAPKFAVRALKLTDWELKLANREPDPWAPLEEVKFWKPKDWSQ